MRLKESSCFVICFLMIFWIQVKSQEDENQFTNLDTITTLSSIFSDDTPAEIILKFDIRALQRNKFDSEYLPAELTFYPGDNLKESHFKVRVRARGISRKKLCSFPPILMNIKRSGIESNLIPESPNIKIVTRCKASSQYENCLLKEFLAYRIYNILSPYSFRVRLLKVKYIDTGRNDKLTETWAFFIEPDEFLAARTNMIPFKLDNLSLQYTDTLWTDVMSVFQFMIGNCDYSIAGRHNIKLLKWEDPARIYPVPVPYDFDYSGIVNSNYAKPRPELGMESMTERYYLGTCKSNQEFLDLLKLFQSKKTDIYSLIEDFTPLSYGERKKMIHYLDEFFDNTNDLNYIRYSLLSTCKK